MLANSSYLLSTLVQNGFHTNQIQIYKNWLIYFTKITFIKLIILFSLISMKTNIKAEWQRITDYQHAEFSKNLEEHIKRAIDQIITVNGQMKT